MPQPATRRGIAHVGAVTGRTEDVNVSLSDPLPVPLTTRNRRPRYTIGIGTHLSPAPSTSTRSSNPRKTIPQLGVRTPTLRTSIAPTLRTDSSSNLGSSSSMVRSDDEQPIAGPSTFSGVTRTRPRLVRELESEPGGERAAKRRRTGRAGTATPEWTSDGDEEIDQLISDTEDVDATTSDSTLEFEPGPPPSQPEPPDPISDDAAEREASVGPSTSNHDSNVTSASMPVSSLSLAKILHKTNVEPQSMRSPSPILVALASTSTSSSTPKKPPAKPPPAEVELLSEYTCPICFFPPTNATLTPCGHVCCGACLFTAVRTTMQRSAIMMAERNGARCPVCRAEIPGWDGRGGGVIGLKPRAVFSL